MREPSIRERPHFTALGAAQIDREIGERDPLDLRAVTRRALLWRRVREPLDLGHGAEAATMPQRDPFENTFLYRSRKFFA